MQYCVSRVRLGPNDNIVEAEWGPLDGHPLTLISESTVSEPGPLVQIIRRGKLVWASFPTPFGLCVGGLLRVARNVEGDQTLELAPSDSQRSLRDMARL